MATAVDQPVLPDYAGPASRNIVPALLEPRSTPPAVAARRGARRRPGRAARARRPGLGPAPGPPAPGAHAGGHGGRPDHHRGARPPRPPPSPRSPPACPRASTAWSATGWPSTARCSTSCAGPRPPATPASASTRRRFQPARRASAASARRSSPRPSSRRSGFTGAHLAERPLHRLPDAVARWSPRCARLLGPASRSSTPTTTASTRSPTSTAWPSTTTPSCAAVDRLVADLLESLPAGRRAGGHRRPRPGRRGRQRRRRSTADVLAHVAFQSGEGRFRWLHARPGRSRRPARRRRRPTTATYAWVRTRERDHRRGLVRARSSPTRPRPAWATSPSWPSDAVSFDDPADTGPFHLIGRHGSLTAAEMLVPLLVGVARG